MRRQIVWPVPLAGALAVGIALGLIYAWLASPVQYYDTAPDRLRPDHKEEYILLVSETYARDGDWTAARRRLDELGDPDLAGTLHRLASGAIAAGRPVGDVRSLASLAQQLGVTDPAFSPFVATRAIPATPVRVATPATPTATPPRLPTATPTPWPSPLPTLTPLPTATPGLHFRLAAQQGICDPDRAVPLLQVIARDADGVDISGAEIIVDWGTGSTHLYTGLKPELGWGYADLAMEPERSYAVYLAAGSERMSGIRVVPCNSRVGARLLSTRLIFEEIQ